ncbi:hypothetical protein, partial [Escherichia coli]|uniref:hypothetical protein n=1 Tax=Escherichia coli TaxID=562 RepID=UPI001954E8C1
TLPSSIALAMGSVPYSYSVYLDEADIQVEYAPSHQAGICHISFGTEGDNALVVNTKNGKLE